MVFWVVIIFLSVFFLPLIFLLIRWWLSYGVLKGCGINGPSPELYHGNWRQMQALGLQKYAELNAKKYGNIYGYYIGIQPFIAVTDLEILKEILIKQFETFTDRANYGILSIIRDESKVQGLVFAKGENWRRMRRLLSKSFNAVNLTKMAPLIGNSCESLVTKFSDYADEKDSFDIWNLYGLYTMEVILATGFGHIVDVINGEADELAGNAQSIFEYGRKGSKGNATVMLSNFPFLKSFVKRKVVKSGAAKNYLFVEDTVKQLVRNRQDEEHRGGNYQDLLQLMIDARADPDDDDDAGYKIMDLNNRKLSDIEITYLSISFILAGFETTNNALAYVSYLLALHPVEQEKVYNEITDFYSTKPNATLYEAAQSMVYLDIVIQESLRIFPPVPFTSRIPSKDVTINGQLFPKDVPISISIISIHHSPDIWPEPSVFRPERFSKEEKGSRHQMAHMPFGWGPRSCIGMRLALIEAKMALIAIMKEYRLVEAPETEKPLKTNTNGITMIPTNGIYLKLQRR